MLRDMEIVVMGGDGRELEMVRKLREVDGKL